MTPETKATGEVEAVFAIDRETNTVIKWMLYYDLIETKNLN